MASTAQRTTGLVSEPTLRGRKRRQELLACAARLFVENGFADTTMQMIAEHAGASKETLYRYFGSKEDLFAEIVSERATSFLLDLDSRFEQHGSVAEVLRALGLKILEAMMDADALWLCRVVIGERARNPGLGAIFMRAGPDRVLYRLTEFLEAAVKRRELACADPATAARIFIGAVTGSYHLAQLVLQDPPMLPSRVLRAHIDEAVAMFMLRHRT